MSMVKWCDIGQHAFPAGQPGSTTLKLEEQVKNQWGGYQPTDTVQDVCSSCARDSGMRGLARQIDDRPEETMDDIADSVRDGSYLRKFGNRFAPKKAIEADGSVKDPKVAAARNYDPAYVAWLEEQEKNAV